MAVQQQSSSSSFFKRHSDKALFVTSAVTVGAVSAGAWGTFILYTRPLKMSAFVALKQAALSLEAIGLFALILAAAIWHWKAKQLKTTTEQTSRQNQNAKNRTENHVLGGALAGFMSGISMYGANGMDLTSALLLGGIVTIVGLGMGVMACYQRGDEPAPSAANSL